MTLHPAIASPSGVDLRASAHVAQRRRAAALIAAGALQTPEDYYHAAMLFQHGERPEDAWRAHELARRAAEHGRPSGRWLVTAYDRCLQGQGMPQKYGGQWFRRGPDQPGVLWQVDPATTDAERAAWGVQPLAKLRVRRPESGSRLLVHLAARGHVRRFAGLQRPSSSASGRAWPRRA